MRKLLQRIRERLTPPTAGACRAFTLLACLLSGLAWACVARLIESQSVWTTLGELASCDPRLWLAALFLGLVCLCLAFLLGLFWGNLLLGLAATVLSLVNYFKVLLTLTPLTVGDFVLAGQVGDIAQLNRSSLVLGRNSFLALACGLAWLVLAWFFSRPLHLAWRRRWPGAAVCALAFFLFFGSGADALVYTPLGAPLEQSVSQMAANQACGGPLGLWRGLLFRLNRDLRSEYSAEYMAEAADRARYYTAGLAMEAADRTPPNIILILSESFFDVTALEGVDFSGDPLPGFHALRREGVSGAFYTRSLGYGTCNIELEVFTGLNTGLLSGEDLYAWDPGAFTHLPAVPQLLREAGYHTSMVHMFDDSIYHRSDIFPSLGFDALYFTEDFDQIYPPAAQVRDYWAYLDSRVSGGAYSDDLMTDLLIAQFEAAVEADDGPVFLYGLSMEGHQPYGDKYASEQRTVYPISGLTGEAAENLAGYAQAAANAQAALTRLADYFADRPEPTVIVFYGDHRPGFGLSEGGTVYSALGLVPWDSYAQTPEDYAYLHSTDYVIWSNDPAYLPAAPGTVRDTGCNYLGVQLLQLAGVDLPLYWRVVAKLSQTRVADTMEYHLARNGVPQAAAPLEGDDALGLSLLRDFLHDAVYGDRYVSALISRPPP